MKSSLASVLSFSHKPKTTPQKKRLRNIIQLVVVDLDALLEYARIRLNHNISGAQHRLFLLSMWVDRRLDN